MQAFKSAELQVWPWNRRDPQDGWARHTGSPFAWLPLLASLHWKSKSYTFWPRSSCHEALCDPHLEGLMDPYRSRLEWATRGHQFTSHSQPWFFLAVLKISKDGSCAVFWAAGSSASRWKPGRKLSQSLFKVQLLCSSLQLWKNVEGKVTAWQLEVPQGSGCLLIFAHCWQGEASNIYTQFYWIVPPLQHQQEFMPWLRFQTKFFWLNGNNIMIVWSVCLIMKSNCMPRTFPLRAIFLHSI